MPRHKLKLSVCVHSRAEGRWGVWDLSVCATTDYHGTVGVGGLELFAYDLVQVAVRHSAWFDQREWTMQTATVEDMDYRIRPNHPRPRTLYARPARPPMWFPDSGLDALRELYTLWRATRCATPYEPFPF